MEQYSDLNTAGMEHFFDPKSIAVIGASGDLTKIGGRPIDALMRSGYTGRILPVNPRYGEIAGIKCYPSILDVPGDIDLAIVSVPANLVPGAMADCAQKNIKAVIVFTSGYGEVGEEGKVLQKELTDFADKHGISILGPNCFGLINLNNNVMASFANIIDLEPISPKSLGFVTQSGAFGSMMYTQAHQEGVGFSSFVSVGNEANREFADFMSYLLDDPETKVLGGYLEGARNGKKLRNMAQKALQKQKPVLILKVGRSQSGSRAASSHTGSLAGDDQIYDAFFKQMGIIRIQSLPELSSFVIVHGGHKPQGRNVAIISGSGGAGVFIADYCESLGLSVPEIKGETLKNLEMALPSFASAKNPIDLTAQAGVEPGLMGKCLRMVLKDDNIDAVFINTGINDKNGLIVTKDIIEAYQSTTKPIILLSTMFMNSSELILQLIESMKKLGIPLLADSLQGVNGLANNVRYQEKLAQVQRRELAHQESTTAHKQSGDNNHQKAQAAVATEIKKLLNGSNQLTEYEGKQILSQYGISITKEKLATSPETAVQFAREIGYPVVLKIQSPQLLHKTESGAIKLNVNGDDEVRAAYHEILAKAKAYMPDAELKGVLVQEMLEGGVEVIIGTTTDPIFGQVIMFGLGGIFVEALKDVSFRVAPLVREDVEEMIQEIKGYRILQGMRGKPPVDFEALTEVILKVSQFVSDYKGQIKELDINPLVVFPKGAKIVDALIVKN